MNLQRYLYDVANARRRELIPTIYHWCQGQVQTGPFTGLVVVPNFMWGDGDVTGKLLGVYEDELHAAIEAAIAANPDLVINVGSAEGYYATGLARRLPQARVIAADLESAAHEIVKINCEANGITNVHTHGGVDPESLASLLREGARSLIVSDCEGYESVLLDPVQVPALAEAWILVETHDCLDPGITERIADRFSATHRITKIEQSGKDPYQFEFLRTLSDCDKWCLVHEGRPETGYWLWMEPQ